MQIPSRTKKHKTARAIFKMILAIQISTRNTKLEKAMESHKKATRADLGE